MCNTIDFVEKGMCCSVCVPASVVSRGLVRYMYVLLFVTDVSPASKQTWLGGIDHGGGE